MSGTELRRPGELGRLQAAERTGLPFVVYRDAAEDQRIHPLPADAERVIIGRRSSCDIALDWDERVSRTHAELVLVDSQWALLDDGLSTNGTFVNGERVVGRRRLADRDVLRVGGTRLIFRHPRPGESAPTIHGEERVVLARVTEAQRRVLVALCRPCVEQRGALPATNAEIAAEVHLSVQAVKQHLRALFEKFAIGSLPQNQKRVRLAQRAIDGGIVGLGDHPA